MLVQFILKAHWGFLAINTEFHVSNGKNPGWLGCIGIILPFVIGSIISRFFEIPINQPGFKWKVFEGFFSWLMLEDEVLLVLKSGNFAWPAGLLAGNLSVPIGFIGWKRLGKEKNPNGNRDISSEKIDWKSNLLEIFGWEFHSRNCCFEISWHLRSHLLVQKRWLLNRRVSQMRIRRLWLIALIANERWRVTEETHKNRHKHQPEKGDFWLPNVKHRPDPLLFFLITWMIQMKNMSTCCHVVLTHLVSFGFEHWFFLPRIRMKGSNLFFLCPCVLYLHTLGNSAESLGPGPFWKAWNTQGFPGLLAYKNVTIV